ncbi:MAG: serine/threonine protein kinase [Lachnospiraceae bacterium]|nr:serine/threonine protein kinase [Lachnospiraceae bacterium]
MKRCYGCFNLIDDTSEWCQYCGYHYDPSETSKWILPPGTILNGKYEIGRSLGEGGFGITYLAWDRNMETKIAIKEYFPANSVSRDTTSQGGNSVSRNMTYGSLDFDEGLKRYVKEASILSKFFELPGIVSVKDFFYENDTAYFVMEYIEGMSLRDYLESRGGRIGYEEALALIQPVISSLHVIHQNNLLHRDISPDNIMISNEGNIKLIDFGAARSMEQAQENGMTVMLKHGYAPIEQYSRNGAQGPYTDVYGVCAVLYRMITGNVPVDATDRATNDNTRSDLLVPIRKAARGVPKHICSAIEKGLSILPEHRQQNMQQLYDELYISRKGVIEKKVDSAYSALIKVLIAVACLLILVAALGLTYRINYDRFAGIRRAIAAYSDEEEEDKDKDKDKDSSGDDEDIEKDTSHKDSEENDENAADSKTSVADAPDKDSSIAADKDQNDTPQSSNTENAPASTITTAEIFGDQSADRVSGYDEEISEAIEAVQNGTLDSGNTPIRNIMESYSDTPGSWDGYRKNDGTVYVQYNGSKDGHTFAVIYKITTNRSDSNQLYIEWTVAGALYDNAQVDDYKAFFRKIMDSYK